MNLAATVSELLHCNWFTETLFPLSSRVVATNLMVSPRATMAALGCTSRTASFGVTRIRAESAPVPAEAMIIAVPGLMPVTTPVLTDATAGLVEVQVTAANFRAPV